MHEEELTDYFTAHHNKRKDHTDLPSSLSPNLIGQYTTRHQLFFKDYRKHPELDAALLLAAAGKNLCFYGYGSKIQLLTSLVNQGLGDCLCIKFKGYSSSLTPEKVYKNLLEMLEQEGKIDSKWRQIRKLSELLGEIEEGLAALKMKVLVVFYCLDGPNFRTLQSQAELSQLCTLPGLQLMASIDNCSFGLKLTQASRKNYNFFYFQVNTYELYTLQLNEESQEQVAEKTLVGAMRAKLASLTNNDRDLLRYIIEAEEGRPRGKGGFTLAQLSDLSTKKVVVGDLDSLNRLLCNLLDMKFIHKTKGDCFKVNYEKDSLEVLKELLGQYCPK